MPRDSMGSGSSRRFFKPNETIREFIETEHWFSPFSCNLHIPDKDEEHPVGRSGHRVVCDDGCLYSFGGYNPADTGDENSDDEEDSCLFPEVWKYNFAQLRWKKLPVRNVPSALASSSVLMSGRIMIAYGGTGVPFHVATSNSIYWCNLDDENPKFEKLECKGLSPPPLYGQAVFMRENYLYTIGGTTGFEYFMDIHRLNLVTKEWEEVYICKGTRTDPPGRYRHELAVVEDKVYLIGGGIGVEAFDLERIAVFDLNKGTWDTLLTSRDKSHGYPSPRQYHSVVNIPGTTSFVLVGGTHEHVIFDDAWRLDIPAMQWSKICGLTLCTPVYFHASTVTPSGKMYVFGGVTRNRLPPERVNHVQSAWICIPKLKEICWEAVVDNGILSEINVSMLPKQYAEKLTL